MKTPPDPQSSIERHSRKCAICTHLNRQAIDEAFLHHSKNDAIVKHYNLPSLSSLYRHVSATGLRHSNRESNRESAPSLTEPAQNSNRECPSTAGVPASSLRTPWESAQVPFTPEIQRMLIGK